MAEGARILIVDDDQDMLHLVGLRLTAAGYQVTAVGSGGEALISFKKSRPQVVVTDLRMDQMDGLALFDRLQQAAPTMPVIILTAHGTIPDAVAATRRGVFSFLTKPFDGQELLRRVADAIRLSPKLDPQHDAAPWHKELITADVGMHELLRKVPSISQEARPCLLVGPHGSGKATLAKAIHRAGERKEGPYVLLSCTHFPAEELEQKLSAARSASIFAEAAGGVLHVQDIGALSLIAQARLLAVLLAQKQVRDPLQRLQSGTSLTKVVDVQIIASSPRPLDSVVAEGSFRSDLFYLLSENTLLIPPLSERSEDISILASHFLATLKTDVALKLSPEALGALQEGRWPGNVRQLKNVMTQVAELSLVPVIPEAIVRRVMGEFEEENLSAFDDARRDFERDYLIRLLQTTCGNVARAARVAQRNRTEFYKLLARHGMDPASFKPKLREKN